jgi:hypothetical protein
VPMPLELSRTPEILRSNSTAAIKYPGMPFKSPTCKTKQASSLTEFRLYHN